MKLKFDLRLFDAGGAEAAQAAYPNHIQIEDTRNLYQEKGDKQ